jgi:hypothetical protein
MTNWYESVVDRRIREAQEQGEFDNLPGTGKPLSDRGREYDEDWWVKDWIRRENVTGLLPPSLALRREMQDLLEIIDRRTSEASVREFVAGVNDRIRQARAGLLDGPPVILPLVDADDVVHRWRQQRGGTAP